MTIDRKAPPLVKAIEDIRLPAIEKLQFSNGVPMYAINSGQQEVLKLELIYSAGRWFEKQKGVASAASKMLLEGTRNKNAQQIAEELDFYGATIGAEASVDFAIITLYCLNKHAERLLELLHELIHESVFPEKELAIYVQNGKQRLAVNSQRVEFLAQKSLSECLYGIDHPAGYTASESDFDSLTHEILVKFLKQKFVSGNLRIILSGKISEAINGRVENLFGKERNPDESDQPEYKKILTSERRIFIQKEGAVQSAIRIGTPTIGKSHPDYTALKVLNTVLGGYFGSRLMTNLREEKGYCYGIHSGIASYLHDSHFYIGTEVGSKVTHQAIDEIFGEIHRLRKELISSHELATVKRYLMGTYLSETDGPFNAAEIFRGLLLFGLDEAFFRSTVSTIQSIDSETLMNLARKYVIPDSMTQVIAGEKSTSTN